MPLPYQLAIESAVMGAAVSIIGSLILFGIAHVTGIKIETQQWPVICLSFFVSAASIHAVGSLAGLHSKLIGAEKDTEQEKVFSSVNPGIDIQQ
jgi:hypothetical protein